MAVAEATPTEVSQARVEILMAAGYTLPTYTGWGHVPCGNKNIAMPEDHDPVCTKNGGAQRHH